MKTKGEVVAAEVIDRVEALRTEEQDLLSMHFAAMRVMESTRGGGWGSFRIDGLSEEQVYELPGYIKGFEGQHLPELFYDEDGSLRSGTGAMVRPEHTKFTHSSSTIDETTGKLSSWFKWDKELWDYEAWEIAQKAEHTIARRERVGKYLRRGILATAFGTELLGAVMMFKGISDAPAVKQEGDSVYESQLADAQGLAQEGAYVMLAGGMVGSVGVVLPMLKEIIKETNKNSRRPFVIK